VQDISQAAIVAWRIRARAAVQASHHVRRKYFRFRNWSRSTAER